MLIKLQNIKNIELCYENCEVDTIEQKHLLGIYINRKLKSPYLYKNKISYRMKTFEIAFKNINYFIRTDLSQLTINYTNGDHDHFFIIWEKNDCLHSYSSLQKTNKHENYISLTSNCVSNFK